MDTCDEWEIDRFQSRHEEQDDDVCFVSRFTGYVVWPSDFFTPRIAREWSKTASPGAVLQIAAGRGVLWLKSNPHRHYSWDERVSFYYGIYISLHMHSIWFINYTHTSALFIYSFNAWCSFHNLSVFDINLSCFLINAILTAFHIAGSKPMRTQSLDTNIQHNFLQRGYNRSVFIYERKLVNRWIRIKIFKPLYMPVMFSHR